MPKVVLISGGSDGLGKAIAKKLSLDNQVVILAHNLSKLKATAEELGCDYVEAELTDFNSIQSAVDQVIAKHKKIDVLVNNAGIWIDGTLDENSPEKVKEVIDVNTSGTILLTKAVLPSLKSQKSGLIINIISQDGLSAKRDRSVYHASKWAITGFTKCLQEDLSSENIKVTGVYPGLLNTSLFQKSGVQRDLKNSLDPSEVASLIDYVINLKPNTYLPDVGIKNILNTTNSMDNTSSPVIDLNIDPNMITPQDDSPKMSPSPVIPPATPTPGIIDITPGADSSFSTPVPTETQIPETPVTDIPTPSQTPVSSEPSTPSAPPLETSGSPVVNPLAEDPDLVNLIK
jgi:NADP-dependent 3-hydroxy acid dehydrogenase YdfG